MTKWLENFLKLTLHVGLQKPSLIYKAIGRPKLYDEIKKVKTSPQKIVCKTIFLAKNLERYLENLPTAHCDRQND